MTNSVSLPIRTQCLHRNSVCAALDWIALDPDPNSRFYRTLCGSSCEERVAAKQSEAGAAVHGASEQPQPTELPLGFKVPFTCTADLVQKLQVALRDLGQEATVGRLDSFDPPIHDDFASVTKDQAKTSVLFELISAGYERRPLISTANRPSGA